MIAWKRSPSSYISQISPNVQYMDDSIFFFDKFSGNESQRDRFHANLRNSAHIKFHENRWSPTIARLKILDRLDALYLNCLNSYDDKIQIVLFIYLIHLVLLVHIIKPQIVLNFTKLPSNSLLLHTLRLIFILL